MTTNMPTDDDWWDGGYLAAFADLLSGEARLLEWDGIPGHEAHECERCAQQVPESEYGVTIHDALWAQVAPRPGEEYVGSGVLCLDCIEEGLGRAIGPDDVVVLVQYGERPTRRAAMLALAPYLAFGVHLEIEDDEQPSTAQTATAAAPPPQP